MEDQPGHNKKFFHHFCIYVCAVLLKNDSTLPLNSEDSILVVGELFEKMRYQGAGSSMINPTKSLLLKMHLIAVKFNMNMSADIKRIV